MTVVPLEIVGATGRVIGTVMLDGPLRLGLEDATALMAKLADEPSPAQAREGGTVSHRFQMEEPEAGPSEEGDAEAQAAKALEAQRENYRSRARVMDAEQLQRWLAAAYVPGDAPDSAQRQHELLVEVIAERLDELNGRAPEPQSVRAGLQPLVDEARRLEAEYREQLAAAEGGDEQARLRATEIRSRLVQLQADIADGVDRQTGEGES